MHNYLSHFGIFVCFSIGIMLKLLVSLFVVAIGLGHVEGQTLCIITHCGWQMTQCILDSKCWEIITCLQVSLHISMYLHKYIGTLVRMYSEFGKNILFLKTCNTCSAIIINMWIISLISGRSVKVRRMRLAVLLHVEWKTPMKSFKTFLTAWLTMTAWIRLLGLSFLRLLSSNSFQIFIIQGSAVIY